MTTETTTARVHWAKVAHEHFGQEIDPKRQLIGTLTVQAVAFLAAKNDLMEATVGESMYGRPRGEFLHDIARAMGYGRVGRAAFAAAWLLDGRDPEHLVYMLAEEDGDEAANEWVGGMLASVIAQWPDGWNPWDSLSIATVDALGPEPEGGWGVVEASPRPTPALGE